MVDGGGSGCRLGAFSDEGMLLASTTEGPANLSLGEEQAWRHIRLGLYKLAQLIGESDDWVPSRLHLGLAGSLQCKGRSQFLALLPQQTQATIVTDGHAQLFGASGGAAGACLAVGTGSVLHWIDHDGVISMAGGWGYPIGDEGSGAWLGMQLINAYLWFRDTANSQAAVPSVLQALEDKIGRDVSDVQLWSTNTSSTELASLAPLIVAAASEQDELAIELLNRGAQQCERLLNLAPSHLPVFLVGGLAQIFQARLSSSIKQRIQAPVGDALTGLFLLSQAQIGAQE